MQPTTDTRYTCTATHTMWKKGQTHYISWMAIDTHHPHKSCCTNFSLVPFSFKINAPKFVSQSMRNYACSPTSALRSTNTGAHPSSCAMTSKHTCPRCLCTSTTELHTHTHTLTNSAKLKIKEQLPFPTYRLGSQSHHGLFTHIQCFSPRTLAICHT